MFEMVSEESKLYKVAFVEKVNDNVYFYLDANKSLVGLRVNNISEENKAILKVALV